MGVTSGVMGLRSALRLVEASAQPMAQLASPWATGNLSTIVWGDFGIPVDALPMSRADALTISAVAKARDLLCSLIARCPLVALEVDQLLAVQPAWLYRTNGVLSPYLRMLYTVDDLLFTGLSLWAVDTDADGYVTAAQRVPRDAWEVTPDGAILVNAKPVSAASVRLIIGPHDGILNRNASTIRAASALDRAYLGSARNPTPDLELHQTGGVPLDQTDIDQLLGSWRTARQGDGGAVAYTPETIQVIDHGKPAEALLIDGRNAAAVDMARICSVPASLVDATNAGASLTYETTQGRNLELLDYGLETYMGPIESVLSQDDWLPAGQRVAFDRTSITTTQAALVGAPTLD